MKGLLKANVKSHASRYVATSIAIALATAFILACLGIANGFYASLERSLATDTLGADVVVSLNENGDPDSEKLQEADQALRDSKKFNKIRTVYFNFTQLESAGYKTQARVLETPQAPFEFLGLESGAAPTEGNNIALDRGTAKSLHVEVGDTVNIEGFDNAKKEPFKVLVKVSGIYPSGTISIPTAVVPADIANKFVSPETAPSYVLLADTDVETVKQVLADKQLTAQVDVDTQRQFVATSVDKFTSGTGVVLAILITFPALAIVTAIIVVSTTFNVLLAQRKRELALLRAIGATSEQIRNLALKEALLVGVFSAVTGVIFGTLLSGVLNYWTGLMPTWKDALLTVSPMSVAISFTLGLLIALIAGFGPARRIAGVSPMVALHPEDPNALSTSKRLVRTVLGSVVFGLGTAVMVGALFMFEGGTRFGVAFVGGMVSFLGALFLVGVLMPKLASFLGRLIGKHSLTTQLAGENTVRNPTRTGATGTALFLGVTLVVMIMVGAESVRHTVLSEIDTKRPVDAVATFPYGKGFADGEVERIKSLKYVDGVLPTDGLITTVAGDGQDPSLQLVVKNVDLAYYAHAEVPQPAETEVLVPKGEFHPDLKEVTVATGSVTLKLKPVVAGVPGYVVSESNFTKLAKAASQTELWVANPTAQDAPQLGAMSSPVAQRVIYIKVDNSIPVDEVTSLFSKIGDNNEEILVSGGLGERITYTLILNVMLTGVVGMLAVSVLVALVGVTNTLALSVVERRRENALLRALGMTRASVRNMLSLEAILIGVSALILGILLGVFYGWAGFKALPLDGLGADAGLKIPWMQVLAISAAVSLAALLASIAPGRKASKAHPVEAMADVN